MQCWKLAIITAAILAGGPVAHADVLYYNATNEGFTVGLPPPLTGPPDAPTSQDPNLGLTVEAGATGAPNLGPDKFLRLTESPGEAPDFRYDIGTSLTSGKVRVSMDLLFENLEDYHVYFRETLTSATSVANFQFRPSGAIVIDTVGGSFAAGTYTAGTSYELETFLDLDADVMDVFLNGTQIASGLAIDDVFGAAIIGFEFTSVVPGPGFDGLMQVDNFQVAAVPEPATLALLGLGLAGLGFGRRRRA